MKIYFYLYMLLVFVPVFSGAQKLLDISHAGDCANAILIPDSGTTGPTTAPVGPGNVLEIKDNRPDNLYYFEKEHNTIWYKFITSKSGLLEFDIIPFSPQDDYDFLLFRCDQDEYTFINFFIPKKIAKPLRTNISRTDTIHGGKTGLSVNARKEFIHSGPGESYSKAIEVKAGEIYYLVLDNVYDNGQGHTIFLKYSGEFIDLSGQIVDSKTNKPVKAGVSLESEFSGRVIAQTETSQSDGKYKLSIPKDSINQSGKYTLSIFANSYFFKDTSLKGSSLLAPDIKKNNFTARLRKLFKGGIYSIDNIIFYGNLATILPQSEPVLKRLYKLMERNKNLVISIEGHTNGAGSMDKSLSYHLKLSQDRAQTVYNYLIKNGIDPKRLSTKGFGCNQMLFPKTNKESEMQKNRRVEIRILEY